MAFKKVKEETKEEINDEPETEVEETSKEEDSEKQLVDILNDLAKRISALESWAFRVKQA